MNKYHIAANINKLKFQIIKNAFLFCFLYINIYKYSNVPKQRLVLCEYFPK
ncbi:hypothetical protein D2M30_1574 [Bacillus amyloliquefaciens]|nr:hypothetical protein D2M30_1574 [Bacillus amyloliquefaciens]